MYKWESGLEAGKQAFKAKEFTQAEQAFKQVINMAPEQAEAYLGLGHVYRKTRQINAALDSYYSALEHHRNSARLSASQESSIYKHIAALELHRRHFNEALAAANQALERNAENANHFRIRGQIYFEIADYQAAAADFEQALNLQPEDNELQQMLEKSRLQRDVTAHLNQALEAYQNARDQDALKAVNQALELDGQNLEGRFLRGKIRTLTRDYNGAEIDLKMVLKALPQHVEIHYRLGDLYRRAKAFDAALTAYNLAEKMNAHFPQFKTDEMASLCFQRAYVYGEMGDFEAAQNDLERAHALQPQSPRYESLKNWLAQQTSQKTE